MNRWQFSLSISLVILGLQAGCSRPEQGPQWRLATDDGPVAWDRSASRSVAEQTYVDGGDSLQCLLVDADSAAALELSSPRFKVSAGRSVAFSFAFRSSEAAGELAAARLGLFDQSGSPAGDTLLYAIRGSAGSRSEGDTRDWIEYTRAVRVPEGVAEVAVSLASHPEKGRVWIGKCSFGQGEGWLAYAATFSTHLGRSLDDRYQYTAGRLIRPEPAPEPRPAEVSAGIMLFERKELVEATPYAQPREDDRVPVLYEKVPRGAVAPFAFAVKALQNLSAVEASLAIPPSGAAGNLKTRPVLYQGRFAATRLEGSWSRVFGVRVRMLEAPNAKPLPMGENLFYWLDVPVPANADPGTYEGTVMVRAAGSTPLEVPFRIEVLPAVLPPLAEKYVVGMYYYPPDDQQLLELQFRDMADHGINGVSLSGSFVEKSPEGRLRVNWEQVARLDRIMALMRRYGMNRPTSLYISDLFRRLELPEAADKWTAEHDQLFTGAVRLMYTTALNRGWSKLMFFPVDEPANQPEQMKLARRTLGLLHAMGDIPVLCDLNTTSSVMELAEFLNAVVIQISSVSPQTVEVTRGKGLSTFFYLPCFGSSDVGGDAAYHRVIPGWFLPRSGTDGIYYFAYQSVAGDPYDELDGGHRDWCAAYPGPEPQFLLPSPEWQGIRRGIEDLRLVQLVRELIERCRAHPDEGVRRTGDQAEQKLNAILAGIADNGPEVIYQIHHGLETYAAESWRRQLLEEVDLLEHPLAAAR